LTIPQNNIELRKYHKIRGIMPRGASMENDPQPQTPPEKEPTEAELKAAELRISNLVMAELEKGTEKPEIAKKLEEIGVSPREAVAVVDEIFAAAKTQAEQEKLDPGYMGPAITAGMLAAIIAGIAWGALAVLTKKEFGYAAIGVGWVSGFAVSKFTGNKKGKPLQVIAVAASFVGLFIGKYISFFYFLKEAVKEKHGEAVSAAMSIINPATVGIFFESLFSILGPFDLLWTALAFYAAWAATKPVKIQTGQDQIITPQ
jgi:hypothetical protein